jgi:small subunit ribosomal protein S4
MGPRFKLVRHLGVNVFNHPKALNREVKKHKHSEYGEQLLEKQKLKAYYGLLEKQFNNYVKKAINNTKENSGEILVQDLETRLDNIIYRLGFASSLRQSRQMVVHGHIFVNDKKVDRPSYKVKVEDELSLKASSRMNNLFLDNFKTINVSLPYLEKYTESFSGKLIKMPNREEIPIDVKDTKILEFYSKNN